MLLQIGKTSGLALTLSGVLKDILLVIASMTVFRDPVSGLQFFGYGIALAGLLYYKLGGDKMKEVVSDSQRAWAEYGNRSPVMRKVLTFVLVLVTVFMLLGGLGNLFPQYDPSEYAKEKLGSLLTNGGV